jgi:hypothetical protein
MLWQFPFGFLEVGEVADFLCFFPKQQNNLFVYLFIATTMSFLASDLLYLHKTNLS